MGCVYDGLKEIDEQLVPSWTKIRENGLGSQTDLISKNELIAALEELPDDAMLCVTQDGTYADSNVGYIFAKPIKVSNTHNIYSVGHSEQII